MTHVTCRLTAKNRDQPRNPTLSNRVWVTFTFLLFLTFGLLTASTSGAGKGEGEEGHAPRAALQGTASGGAKIWNSEI